MASSINKLIPLYPLLLINFIGTLGFSIVLPFLVFLVIDFGGNAIIYGILAAVYPAFQLIGAPILGRWSDIYGRKKVLLVSNGGTLIGWIFFLFALFLPVENLFSIDSSLFGTFAITLPLLYYFLPELLMELQVAIFLLPMHILQIFLQMKIEVKTLVKWQYLLILVLSLDLH